MLSEEAKALAKVRLEHALEDLKSAKENFENSTYYKLVANRTYYAIFHAMRAVLAFDGIDNKKHSSVISDFRKLYVKTGIFDVEMSDIITKLFNIRSCSDYDDFYVIEKEKVKQQLDNAEIFINNIKAFLEKERDIK